ncbi:MAG: HepT-like ribonuclease domain-containing protein [Bacteroidota bacterium]|nr:HepT-like ribonuclease domain-containing protein [Bacteroidota bacterium]
MAYRDVSVWLEDVLMAISPINHYIKDVETYAGYTSNFLVRDATERNLEIIAEALKNAIKQKPDLAISDTIRIIGLRNIINHQYYDVEHDRI